MLTEKLLDAARDHADAITALRRAIHAEPELGLETPRTMAKVKDALADLPAYLDIMQQIYSSTSFLVDEPRRAAPTRINSDASERRQAIERSTFLQLLLPKLTGGGPPRPPSSGMQ